MTIKIIDVNNQLIISCLTNVDDDSLHFYCLDKISDLSYSEILPISQLINRIRQVNKRVHFPTKSVHAALYSADPIEAAFSTDKANESGILISSDRNDPGHIRPPRTVLSLKYFIQGAPASLKWEWHLSNMDNLLFYRCAFKDALCSASCLNNRVYSLLGVVDKKDIELKQFRIEGATLRRSTVATEPFDLDGFRAENKQMLADTAAYDRVLLVLDNIPAPLSIKNELHIEPSTSKVAAAITAAAATAATAAAATAAVAAALYPSTKITAASATLGKPPNMAIAADSPINAKSLRNRKRKIVASGTEHIERKVQQRRRAPVMMYKDSQSQEEMLNAEVADTNNVAVKLEGVDLNASDWNNAAVKWENVGLNETEIKKDPANEIASILDVTNILVNNTEGMNIPKAANSLANNTETTNVPGAVGNIDTQIENEFDDIMRLIEKTEEDTKRMLQELNTTD